MTEYKINSKNQQLSDIQMIIRLRNKPGNQHPLASSDVKYLGITLTMQVNNLYDKDFKSLRKKLQKISDDGKISHAHGLIELT